MTDYGSGRLPMRDRIISIGRQMRVTICRPSGYFSLIGGAIFSAGAAGSAGLVAAPCVFGSGRAGSGAGVVGRSPPGFDSAGVLL
ncbi:bsr7764 [Bradyrhizobium diazoefficiens USDA 110]|uniref:Bsr7764 protein n=1 Tax=Bradyrhizobium diazoefficiens (strain JCM 10833 / BCRC 13528 / IAM 13628 / NBRC 14792 / USDA 110) TaxID=224911 RepID=Q89CN3_BRADU|nr:hypothetical protein CO678_25340 [Bradyrhizobium diazoefficiens]QBP26497.1 hypothetical protein Bdiaspc4_41075 [Bradyrhizobium diazoefficiens]BAC53029.1 bsr7764 [Bradyrhizobium diazoefficiens USDA 110]